MGFVLLHRPGPFIGMPVEVGYPSGLGFLVNFRYSSGLYSPNGLHGPTAIQGWSILVALIIAVGELLHRFGFPSGIQIMLLCRVILLGCISPSGWLVLISRVAFSSIQRFRIARDISYWMG